jgi:aminopeptidase N
VITEVRKMRRTIVWVGVLLAGLLVGPTSGVSADSKYSPGAAGIGDPYFPKYGNGGYDAQHYDLAIRYKPKTDHLWGVATIDALATQGLSSFNLDFVGLTVRSITVDGAPAIWSRTKHELTVAPAAPIDDGSSFTAQVTYDGVPVTFFVPLFGDQLQMGFIHTSDGAIVAGAPQVAAFWYPANDHPVDRATYTFDVTVPEKYGVVANGLPTGTEPHGDWTTYSWRANDPMAAYLATIDIGKWIINDYVTDRGLRVIDAIDPRARHESAQKSLSREEEILAFLEDTFGPYPFETAGAIVDPGAPFDMETQTRAIYGDVPKTFGVVHELSHMWFGDLVAVNRWKDTWLNEGFAIYAEWLWEEREGGATMREAFEAAWAEFPADGPFWQVVVADPGVADIYAWPIYMRGAMTVQALRNEVGDEDFWQIVDAWLDSNAWATGSTEEFMTLAEQVSGQDLDAFFETWLFTPEKPPKSAVMAATARGSILRSRTAADVSVARARGSNL